MTSKKNKARSAKDTGRKFKKKSNPLASDKVGYIDYKDVNLLQRFMSDRSKIRGRRMSGVGVQEQRDLATAIKNAREMALLPYTKRVASTRAPRGERGERGERSDRGERGENEQIDDLMPLDVEAAIESDDTSAGDSDFAVEASS